MSTFVKFIETAYDEPREVWINTGEVSSVCETMVSSDQTLINLKGGESYLVDDNIYTVISKLEIDY